MTLLKTVKEEFEEKGMINIPFLVERLVLSIGNHLLNLYNLDEKKFYDAGRLENFRTHPVFVAPSGFGKSILFNSFLDKNYGLLKGTGIMTDVRDTFSPESWMGTAKSSGSEIDIVRGVLHKFRRGILGIDDFVDLRFIMAGDKSEGRHDVNYLLKALDDNRVTKDLCYANIEVENVGITIWSGIRPTTLDPKASTETGFLRRLMFHIYYPTPRMINDYKKAVRDKRRKKPFREETRDKIIKEVNKIREVIPEIDEFDLKEVEEWINGNRLIPHFEEIVYKRIAIGYSLVSNPDYEIKLTDDLVDLFNNELKNRLIMKRDLETEMICQVVEDCEGELSREELIDFFNVYYQLRRPRIEQLLYKLNLHQRITIINNKIYLGDKRKKVWRPKQPQ